MLTSSYLVRPQVLLKHNMLSEEEVQQVAVYRGFKPFLLQVWAMQTIRDYLDSGADKAAGAGIGPFQAQALALRANCSDVVNLLAQPVPFPYYHVVSFMLCVNLFGMAYAAARNYRAIRRAILPAILCAQFSARQFSARNSLTPHPSTLRYALIGFNSVMTIPVFFVVCLVLLGMKETAVMLSDPFGGDAVDFDCDQARATRRRRTSGLGHHPIPTPGHPHTMPALTHVSLTPPRPRRLCDKFMASILNNTRALLSRGADLKPTQLPVPAMLLDSTSGDYGA